MTDRGSDMRHILSQIQNIMTGKPLAEAPGAEKTYFGGWKPSHGIDSSVERLFMAGYCGYLALALAEVTDWLIETELNGRDGNHVWVSNDDGQAVDIRGVFHGSYPKFPGCPAPRKRDVISISTLDQERCCDNTAVLELARTIVRFFPQHFGIDGGVINEAAEAPLVFKGLDELKTWAASIGVSLDVSEHETRGRGYDRVIDLSWIERSDDAPAGQGAKVVAALCRYADAHHAKIELQAADEINLPAYYEEFGFQEFEDENADHDVRPSGPDMRRMPVGKRTGKRPAKATPALAPPVQPRPSMPVVVVLSRGYRDEYTVLDAESAQARMDDLTDWMMGGMDYAQPGSARVAYLIDTPDWTELRSRTPFDPNRGGSWALPPSRVTAAQTPEMNRWRDLTAKGKVICTIKKLKRGFSVR